MTNNQLAENSVIQLLDSVKLARDNAERADNRVDHSFYYALTIALEELQERRKAAEGYKNLNEMEQRAEQAECLIMCLDDLGVPNTEGSESLSLWGRVKIFAEENSKDRAELQERRKADSEPVAYISKSDLDAGYPHILARRDFNKACTMAVYAAQPAPVVPEEKPIPNTLSMYAVDAVAAIAEVKGWNACRAAMLEQQLVDRVDEKSLTSINPAPDLVSLQKKAESIIGNYPGIPDCWCRTCRPVVLNDMRFVVCHDCGNKRCPRANDHRNACTGSNEPGQEGSAYQDTLREVK